MYRNVHKSQAAVQAVQGCVYAAVIHDCLLYTSDAADE